MGVCQVPGGPAAAPAVAGVNPSQGGGSIQSFTFTFTDTKGYYDLGVVNILIHSSLDGRPACYLAYSRPLNVLYLVDDPGTGLLPGLPLSSGGTLSNGQCVVDGARSSFMGAGNTLTLTLNVSFTPEFSGNRIVYAAARDVTDLANSGWQAVGTWSAQ